MKRSLVIGCMLLIAAYGIYAEGFLEGTAIVGDAALYPTQGSFVSTNAFPPNSIIELRDLSSGRTARAIVIGRLDLPGIFIRMSPQTAASLDAVPGDMLRLRALPVTMPGMTDSSPLRDLPAHPDPDINPTARFGDPNAGRFLVSPRISEPEPEPLEEPELRTEPEVKPEPKPEPKSEPKPEPEPEPEAAMPVEPVEQPVATLPQIRQPEDTVDTVVRLDEPSLRPGPELDWMRPQPVHDERRFLLEDAPLPAVESSDISREDSLVREVPDEDMNGTNGIIYRPSSAYRRRFDPDERPSVVSRLEAAERANDFGILPGAVPPEASVPDSAFLRLRPEEWSGVLDLPLARLREDSIEYIADRLPPPEVPSRSPVKADLHLAELAPRDRVEAEPRLVLQPVAADLDEFQLEEPRIADLSAVPEGEPETSSPQPAPNGTRSFVFEPAEPRAPAASPEVKDVLDVPETPEVPEVPEVLMTMEPEPPAEEPVVSRITDADLPLVDSLDAQQYYVQIGAYGTPAGAKAAVDGLGPHYPRVVTQAGTASSPVLRVFVGPLNEDEKGGALLWLRSKGYVDAFVRMAR
ncbi:SPOR domain-containing protein [Spirochaeta dissipatitropha]